MKSAFDFQLEVVALVNPLPRDNDTMQAVELALHCYQADLLAVAMSSEDQHTRQGRVAFARLRLIERLEDLHDHSEDTGEYIPLVVAGE